MSCIFIQVCSLTFLQQMLLSVVHRRMTRYLNYIWGTDNPLRVSTGSWTLYTRIVLLCSISRSLPTLEVRISQLRSFDLHSHGHCFLNLKARMVNPCTIAEQLKCFILRQVSPLMCCFSNRPTQKHSILAFSLL